MATVDFITALGRVLHDGALRDAFARDASAFVETIDLRESDRSAFLQLSPTELEVQARILLRKRFDQVRRLVPRTCQALGKSAWEQFVASFRSGSNQGAGFAAADAGQFCAHLARAQPNCVCAVELNRCRFASSERRLSVHLLKRREDRRFPAIQLLVRFGVHHWREWQFYVGV